MSAPPPVAPCPTPQHGALIATYPTHRQIGQVSCKRWSCPSCSRRNARKLERRLQEVKCNRFLTLTYRMKAGETTGTATATLKSAWVKMRKQMARKAGLKKITFVLVVEWTAAGAPHLHVLLSSPYFTQKWLSRAWRDLTGSPIVDIRRVKHGRNVAAYLAKYVSKQQLAVPHLHRYSASHGFLPKLPPREWLPEDVQPAWSYQPRPPYQVAASLQDIGWRIVAFTDDSVLALPPQLEDTDWNPTPNTS